MMMFFPTLLYKCIKYFPICYVIKQNHSNQVLRFCTNYNSFGRLRFHLFQCTNNNNLQTAPYGYEKKSPEHLEGNNRYEGFTIDLIEKIAEMLGFNYEFELEADYGGIDTVTHKWTGMVLKLIEEVFKNILYTNNVNVY